MEGGGWRWMNMNFNAMNLLNVQYVSSNVDNVIQSKMVTHFLLHLTHEANYQKRDTTKPNIFIANEV